MVPGSGPSAGPICPHNGHVLIWQHFFFTSTVDGREIHCLDHGAKIEAFYLLGRGGGGVNMAI